MKVDVQYLEKLDEFHNDLLVLAERMKNENVQKLAANSQDKTEYGIHIRNLKSVLNHELALKNIHKVIKFSQNAWLKPYIEMNTHLRKKRKSFKKIWLSFNNSGLEKIFWRIWESIEILNLSQHKEKEPIWQQNQIIILQSFFQNIY